VLDPSILTFILGNVWWWRISAQHWEFRKIINVCFPWYSTFFLVNIYKDKLMKSYFLSTFWFLQWKRVNSKWNRLRNWNAEGNYGIKIIDDNDFKYLALKVVGAAKKAGEEKEGEIEVDKNCVGDILRFFTTVLRFCVHFTHWDREREGNEVIVSCTTVLLKEGKGLRLPLLNNTKSHHESRSIDWPDSCFPFVN